MEEDSDIQMDAGEGAAIEAGTAEPPVEPYYTLACHLYPRAYSAPDAITYRCLSTSMAPRAPAMSKVGTWASTSRL